MAIITCSRLLSYILSEKTVFTFGLALFLPGLCLHVAPHSVRLTWAEVLAYESRPNHSEEALLTLKLALDHALTGNPGLAEIRARAEALAAVPAQMGALPDPTVSFDMQNVPTRSFDLRKEDMTMLGVGISQAFPFPGKLALRERIAEKEALAAVDSVDEARLRLMREVKQSWWRLFYYDRALNLLNDAEGFFCSSSMSLRPSIRWVKARSRMCSWCNWNFQN